MVNLKRINISIANTKRIKFFIIHQLDTNTKLNLKLNVTDKIVTFLDDDVCRVWLGHNNIILWTRGVFSNR